jgi:hypothetical protein
MGNAATKDTSLPPTEVSVPVVTKQQYHRDEERTVRTEGSSSAFVAQVHKGSSNDLAAVTVVTLPLSDDSDSVLSAITVTESFAPVSVVRAWDKNKLFSDFIQDGLKTLKKNTSGVCMLFESPVSACQEISFFNGQSFKFHDYPPSPALYKAVLTPCRYAMMNGSVYPTFLQDGRAPKGLIEHWRETIPGFVESSFVSELPEVGDIYAYLPVESVTNYVNDPHVHYHLCGKDALHLSKYRSILAPDCT